MSMSPLEALPPHLLFRTVVYLDENDKQNLFSLAPPPPPHVIRQRQMMMARRQAMMRQQAEAAKKRAQEERDDEEESETAEGEQDESESDASENEEESENEEDTQEGQDTTDAKQQQEQQQPEAPVAGQPKRPMVRRQMFPPMAFAPDADTLLARLNTRRLFKRIQAAAKDNSEYKDLEGPLYSRNMTTKELAAEEWNNLLKRAAKKANPPIISPAHELLLFSPCPRSVSVLASYPRSGNSLMRTLFERLTLRVTGSDMRGGLTKHDLVGEAAVSTNRVQFVKTHYPERRGTPPFKASRVVLLVRNPYDAIESYFNLMMTSTHTTSIPEEQREKHKAVWEEMALKEIQVWKEFHEYWLRQEVPLLLVRYEDLIRYPEQVMSRVVKFVLEINNMNFFSDRIKRCISDEKIEQLGSYQPRSGGIGKSLRKYSPELLQQMNFGILSTMEKLEYGEMLVPNKDDWELEPMEGFGREYFNGNNVITLNVPPLVRGPQQTTNWMAIKRQMMGIEAGPAKQCQCPRCMGSGR